MLSYSSVLPNENNTYPGYSEVFLDYISDIGSSIKLSFFKLSSNCKNKFENELKDKLILKEKEEQLLLEYYLYKAKSLNII